MNDEEDDGDDCLKFNNHRPRLGIELDLPSDYASLIPVFLSILLLSKTFSISFAIVIGAYQIYTNSNCVYLCELLRLLLLCEVNYCNVRINVHVGYFRETFMLTI